MFPSRGDLNDEDPTILCLTSCFKWCNCHHFAPFFHHRSKQCSSWSSLPPPSFSGSGQHRDCRWFSFGCDVIFSPQGTYQLNGGRPIPRIRLASNGQWQAGMGRTDQWTPRALIWSIQPNCVSFDAYFYDNDFPNMSDVVWAGSDLTVDLSSPIYFIPHRTVCRIWW